MISSEEFEQDIVKLREIGLSESAELWMRRTRDAQERGVTVRVSTKPVDNYGISPVDNVN